MTDSPNPIPTRVLDYAIKGLDRVPDWNEQAEKLISAGRPPSALVSLFATPGYAAKYFAKSISRRHDISTAGNRCIGCSGEAEQYVVKVGWWADVWSKEIEALSRPLSFETSKKSLITSAEAITVHAICPNCYRLWRRRIRNRIFTVFGIGVMLSVLLLIAVCILLSKGRLDALNVSAALSTAFFLMIVVVFLTSGLLSRFAFRQYPAVLNIIVGPHLRHSGEIKIARRAMPEPEPTRT